MDARRRTQRLAIVVDGKIPDVKTDAAGCRLVGDNHREPTAVDAVAKRQTASTSKAGMRKPLMHLV
jgi:hypothetical protein